MQENTKKPKIFIATPMYGGMCAGFYTQSIIQLLTTCQANGVDAEFSFMFNESLITRARNSLTPYATDYGPSHESYDSTFGTKHQSSTSDSCAKTFYR